MTAIHYENGRRSGSEKVNTLAEPMARYPRHEVNAYPNSDKPELVAILTDTGSCYSVIRLYAKRVS